MSDGEPHIFQRYIHAGPMTRNPAAVAALFTEDGVIEWPLLGAGSALPRRMTGRAEIERGLTELYAQLAAGPPREADLTRSGFVLHLTADPDVFIAEIDTTFAGSDETMALVQVFRLRDGLIERLRDYFSPAEVER